LTPDSPDNNDIFEGAMPIGKGAGEWSTDRYPQLKIDKLNILPINDQDNFKLTTPNVEHLSRICSTPSLAVSFSQEVFVILSTTDGRTLQFNKNTSYFTFPISSNASDYIIRISAAFPGQVMDYEMEISYFLAFKNSKECLPPIEKPKWQLLKDCVACNHELLTDDRKIVLDPPYRIKSKVAAKDYYFQYEGGSQTLDIPVRILSGNGLHADLLNDKGEIVGTAKTTKIKADGSILHLKSAGLPRGVYSLRFSGFGNGTNISVDLPNN
jgi:hypothetical protein